MAETQHKLRQVLQDGATNANNVIKWSGTVWAPAILASTNISDFVEAAQDATGAMLDANSLEYTDATPLLAVKRQLTITADASGIKLVNDAATPGNNKIYGTDGSGTKGWYNSPSGADGNGIYTGSGTIGNGVAASTTNATLPSGNSSFNLRYNGGANALNMTNGTSSGTITLANKAANYSIQILDVGTNFIFPNGSMGLEDGQITITDATTYFNTTASPTPDTKALVDINSTDRALLLPRFNAGEFTTFSGTATTAGMVLFDTATDTLKLKLSTGWVDLADSGSALITASNGLTKVGSDVQLGGTLTSNTVIDGTANFLLTLTGSRAGGANSTVQIANTSGNGNSLKSTSSGTGAGVWGVSTTGTGVYGSSGGPGVGAYTTSNVGIYSQVETSGTTDTLITLQLDRLTSGTAGNGLGSKILFTNETSTTPLTEANSIVSKWSNATHAARLAEFSITGYNIGTENTLLKLSGTGQASMPLYGAGTFVGTAAKTLQVTAAGLIIEGSLNPPVGSGGIYGGSGTIAAACVATVTASSTFTIDYNGGADAILVSDATPAITLKSKNSSSTFVLNNTGIAGIFATNNTAFDLTSTGFRAAYDDGGSAPQTLYVDSAGVRMDSTTKMLRPPRMTTAQRTGPTMTETGGFVYDTDTNKMYYRNNTTFKEIGIAPGGIYGGSGSIPNATVATLSATGDFTFDYSTGADAIRIVDDTSGIIMKSKDASKTLRVQDSDINFASGGLVFKIDGNGFTGVSSPLLIDYTGLGVSNHSGIELRATDRAVILSRMTTTNRDTNLTAPVTGTLLYNTTTSKFNFYENNAWVAYMVDAAGVGGIYKGSGTIASGCVSTATANSFWNVKYAGTAGTAINLDSTTGSEKITLKGKDTGSYGTLVLDGTSAKLNAGSSAFGITVTEGITVIDSSWHNITKRMQASGVVTPSTFGATQNNYDIDAVAPSVFLRLETTVNDTQITGMTHGKGLGNFADASGRIIYIKNIGATNTIRLMGNNAGSNSEYRIISTRAIAAGETHGLWYDGVAQRWQWLQGA